MAAFVAQRAGAVASSCHGFGECGLLRAPGTNAAVGEELLLGNHSWEARPFAAFAAAAATAIVIGRSGLSRRRRRTRFGSIVHAEGDAAADAALTTAASSSSSWRALSSEVAAVALPNVGSFLLQLVNEQTNVIFLGQTGGNASLAAVGLGNMMQNCVGLSVGWGLLGALDTLVSQAHGSGRDDLAVDYFQRGRVIATLQLLWILPVLFCTEGLLMSIGQDPTVSSMAASYNRASAPALFCLFQFQATAKFLQNRCSTVPPMLINLLCSLLHVGWCALFVLRLGLGNAGAGLANSATWTCQWIFISIYLALSAKRIGLPRRALLGLQSGCLKGWRRYLRIAIPCLLQTSSEWWFWEIGALVVGYLGTVSLAAHVASLQVVALAFMPTLGIAAACAALVGNALGAGDAQRARRVTVLGLAMNLGVWLAIAVGILVGRGHLARIYMKGGEAAGLMQVLLAIYAFAGFADSTQNVMAGILRGMGRTALASAVYLLAYYGLMLPLGCYLAFGGGCGVRGLWYAFGVGTSVAVAVFGVALSRTRLDELAQRVSKQG